MIIPASDVKETGGRVVGGVWDGRPATWDPRLPTPGGEPLGAEGIWGKELRQLPEAWLAYAFWQHSTPVS